MSKVEFVDGLTMFNTPIGTNKEYAEDIIFNIQTDIIVDIANSSMQDVVGGTMEDNKETLERGIKALNELVAQFRDGVENDVFRKEDVEAMALIVADFIATPLKYVDTEA